MTEIAAMLKAALDKRGWSIKDASTRLEVERTFLGRLASGKKPPRQLHGSRRLSTPDPRYERIATGLGLDEKVFLEAVAREQSGEALWRRRKAETKTGAKGGRLTLPGDMRKRYRRIGPIFDELAPLEGTRILELADRCLAALLQSTEAIHWQDRLRLLLQNSWTGSASGYEHVGTAIASEVSSRFHPDVRLCMAIADGLSSSSVNSSADETDIVSAKVRVEIAAFFFELGVRSAH